ncbi:hypothetical protein L9F63_028051, partial [Diploptera punctata]
FVKLGDDDDDDDESTNITSNLLGKLGVTVGVTVSTTWRYVAGVAVGVTVYFNFKGVTVGVTVCRKILSLRPEIALLHAGLDKNVASASSTCLYAVNSSRVHYLPLSSSERSVLYLHGVRRRESVHLTHLFDLRERLQRCSLSSHTNFLGLRPCPRARL